MKHLLAFTFIFLSVFYSKAQDCLTKKAFFILNEGIVNDFTPEQEALLNQEAIKILNIKDAELCESFGVFDVANYQMKGYDKTKVSDKDLAAYKAACTKQKPYYLLLIRQYDENKNLIEIQVELSLPTDKKFYCMSETQHNLLKIRMEQKVFRLMQFNLDLEITTIDSIVIDLLQQKIENEVNCCKNDKDNTFLCTKECFESSDIYSLMKNYRFQTICEAKIASETYANKSVKNVGGFYDYANITLELPNGKTTNFKSMMKKFIEDAKMTDYLFIVTSDENMCIETKNTRAKKRSIKVTQFEEALAIFEKNKKNIKHVAFFHFSSKHDLLHYKSNFFIEGNPIPTFAPNEVNIDFEPNAPCKTPSKIEEYKLSIVFFRNPGKRNFFTTNNFQIREAMTEQIRKENGVYPINQVGYTEYKRHKAEYFEGYYIPAPKRKNGKFTYPPVEFSYKGDSNICSQIKYFHTKRIDYQAEINGNKWCTTPSWTKDFEESEVIYKDSTGMFPSQNYKNIVDIGSLSTKTGNISSLGVNYYFQLPEVGKTIIETWDCLKQAMHGTKIITTTSKNKKRDFKALETSKKFAPIMEIIIFLETQGFYDIIDELEVQPSYEFPLDWKKINTY
jgi:hypothetical protein